METTLNFDVLLYIFYTINDYDTLINYSKMNKEIYYYTRNNKTPRIHIFKCLSKKLFEILYLLPNEEDVEGLVSKCDKNVLKAYIVYKKFIHDELHSIFGERYLKCIGNSLTNIILIQGPDYIFNNVAFSLDENFNSSNGSSPIKLSCKKKYIIDNFVCNPPFNFIKERILLFEELISRQNRT